MNLGIRKNDREQAESTAASGVSHKLLGRYSFLLMLSLSLLFWLFVSITSADIYRFTTVDGVETFTDAPSNRAAKVIIKDPPSSSKKKKKVKKEKIHNISLDEIVKETVSATLNPNEVDQKSFEPHLPLAGTITSKVGMRIDPIDGIWRHHNGIDIAVPSGTAVKPVAPGIVIYSGLRPGYGNTVLIEHNNGVVTLYAHNNQRLVSEGQAVTSDSTIAFSGSTGRSTGPHLHFEAWQGGTNITSAFLTGNNDRLGVATEIISNRKTAQFRSQILSDGSVLFTNIP